MTEVHKRHIKKPVYGLFRIIEKISFSQVFTFWLVMIILFGGTFFLLALVPGNSLKYGGEVITYDLGGFVDSLYFSFITATSLGYGDVAPVGLSKFLAGFEVILGLIIYGVLISKLVGVKQEVLLEEVYNISYEEVIDRLRSGLYLFRADINRALEKVENDTIKQREVQDLWIFFSGLDTTLINIKNLIIPGRSEKYYHKTIDAFRLELFLNSIQLSMDKIVELLKALKSHKLKWKNELLVTSIEDDVQVVRNIVDYLFKKGAEKKVIDKLEELQKTLDIIETELGEKNKKDKDAKKEKQK
ncbi:potassium channel family protein [Candidatus Woesearchaeota archaeon]|nr:potassium channel family protein [Candidatus Woesearchaeota archaeon]